MLRRWAPLAAAVAVVAVAVTVSLTFSRGSSGRPPLLRLAAGTGTGAALPAAAATADGKRAATGSSFTLVGSLPSGPDAARAHPLPPGGAGTEAVRRLAGALGITDAPRRVDRSWQAGSLRVEDAAGQPWSLSGSCGPDVPVSSDGAVASCTSVGVGVATVGPGAVSGSSGSGSSGSGTSTTDPAPPPGDPGAKPPAPAVSPCPDNARCAAPEPVAPLPPPPTPGPPVDINAARQAASLVLADLGLSDADVSVQPAGELAFVQADPQVDGLPTSGFGTQLEIDASGRVLGGSGYLGKPSAGASYPLVSARSAFDALPELPRPMLACVSSASCPEPAPAEVTGAQLGLQLTALAGEEAALLPAWLFAVKDWPMPLAQPAIEPRFLTVPTPDRPKDLPLPVDPAPNGPSRTPFGFDTAFPADDPKSVVVQYGDSGSCPRTGVTHAVKESADAVVVLLEADGRPSGRACTDDYRQVLVTLELQAPLGRRTVMDGSRGTAVPVDRTCSRPMGGPPVPKGTAC